MNTACEVISCFVVFFLVAGSAFCGDKVQDAKAREENIIRAARKFIEKGMYEEAREFLLEAKEMNPSREEIDKLLQRVSSEQPHAKLIDAKDLEKVVRKIELKDARLEEVVKHLSKRCGVNIVISREALEAISPKPAPPGPEGDAAFAAPEVRPNGDITISLKDVPLKAVLKYVLRMKGLKYIVEDYAIVIVPRDYVPRDDLETEVFRLNVSGQGTTDTLRRGF